jgi:hypothetical protein
LNNPGIGGPFVVTTIEADESPHDRRNIKVEVGGSEYFLITKLTAGFVVPAGIDDIKGDAAAVLRLKEVLLVFTAQTDVQTTFVITSPVRINMFCGLTYVTD